MSDKTILAIDDSSTIRRLVDSTLSRAGYAVALAPSAEDGVRLAEELCPDMILLDHQLPGATGFDVCQQLLASPRLGKIPVVISSTLRKKAYVEYSEMSNVVDMLPKPYTEELLVTTVANALNTGALVVESQAQGTAVPEVIEEVGEPDLSGVFPGFTIREVIDFLNNGHKQGVLEIESGHNRFWIQLDEGRVQGITATGIQSSDITDRLPDALKELAPVLNVTLGNSGSELNSIVDLLNTNVLDPRLLRKLLRHQASVLLTTCFTQPLHAFRFNSKSSRPAIFERLPLNVSVLALLVEGALTLDADQLPPASGDTVFARLPIRGQNLDRAGLTAQHARILGQLTSPRSVSALASNLKWEAREVRHVLFGLELAELVAAEGEKVTRDVVLFEPDLQVADSLNNALDANQDYNITVAYDPMAFQLYIKRTKPAAIVIDLSTPLGSKLATDLRRSKANADFKWIAVTSNDAKAEHFHATLARPYTAPALIDVLNKVFRNGSSGGPSGASNSGSQQASKAVNYQDLPNTEEQPTLCPQ